jgi:hypothetical protein
MCSIGKYVCGVQYVRRKTWRSGADRRCFGQFSMSPLETYVSSPSARLQPNHKAFLKNIKEIHLQQNKLHNTSQNLNAIFYALVRTLLTQNLNSPSQARNRSPIQLLLVSKSLLLSLLSVLFFISAPFDTITPYRGIPVPQSQAQCCIIQGLGLQQESEQPPLPPSTEG